jgi:hypothetical protein
MPEFQGMDILVEDDGEMLMLMHEAEEELRGDPRSSFMMVLGPTGG